MAENTGISWVDSTFNPWIGCQKVGPGCDHCYAEHLMDTRLHRVNWGPSQPRKRTSAANWRQPLLWEREHEAFALAHGRRRRVFCASLADVFDNQVDREWRDDLATLIATTPHLDWLLLTKRISNAGEMLGEMFLDGPPDNIWLGITVVNREELLRDGPKLMSTHATTRFWSAEPLLEDLGEVPTHLMPHWVIVGGESGAQARPFHVDWARSIVTQCKTAGVPVHVKQLGAQPRGWCAGFVHCEPADREDVDCDFYEAHEQGAPCPGRCAAMVDKSGGDWDEWPEDLRVREWPTS